VPQIAPEWRLSEAAPPYRDRQPLSKPGIGVQVAPSEKSDTEERIVCFPAGATDQAGAIQEGFIEQPESITSLDPALPAAGNAPTATSGAVESAEPDPRPSGTAGGSTGGFFAQSRVVEAGVAGTALANPITLERLQSSLLIAAPGSREAERAPLTALSDDTGGRFFDSELGAEQRSAITRVFEGVGLRAPEFTDEGFLTQQFQQQQLPGFLSFLDDVRAAEGREEANIEGIDRTQLGFTTEDIVEDFGGVRELLRGFDSDFVPESQIRGQVNEALGFDATQSLRDPRELVPGGSDPSLDAQGRRDQLRIELGEEQGQQAEDDLRDELEIDRPQVIIDRLASGEISELQVRINSTRLQDLAEANSYLESVGLDPFDATPINDETEQAQFIFNAISASLGPFTGPGSFAQVFPIVPLGEGQRRFDALVLGNTTDKFQFDFRIAGQDFQESDLGEFFQEAQLLYSRLFTNFGSDPPQNQIDVVNDFIRQGFEDFGVDVNAEPAVEPTPGTPIGTPTDDPFVGPSNVPPAPDPDTPVTPGTPIGTPTDEPFVGPPNDAGLITNPDTGETTIDFTGLFAETFQASSLDNPGTLQLIRSALIDISGNPGFEQFTAQQIQELADDELKRLILESLSP
jgi:hypothetical protein